MILLFGTHYGKDTSELDSGYLIWIVEHYEKADWTLLNACKQELFARLKLDWQPPTDNETLYLRQRISLENLLEKRDKRIALLENLLGIAILSKGNHYLVNVCESRPAMVREIIEGTKLLNEL